MAGLYGKSASTSQRGQSQHRLFTIICDVSFGMRAEQVEAVKDAIEHILDEVMLGNDLLELISASARPVKLFDLSASVHISRKDLRTQLALTRADLALYDAIVFGIKTMERHRKYQHYLRKVLIITHGAEKVSKSYTFNQVKAQIDKPGVPNADIRLIGIDADVHVKLKLMELCRKAHSKYIDCDGNPMVIRKKILDAARTTSAKWQGDQRADWQSVEACRQYKPEARRHTLDVSPANERSLHEPPAAQLYWLPPPPYSQSQSLASSPESTPSQPSGSKPAANSQLCFIL